MTLRLREDGTVLTVLLPEPIRGVPDGVAFSWADQKKGLLLRSVSSASREHVGSRTRTQLRDSKCRMSGKNVMMNWRWERFAQSPNAVHLMASVTFAQASIENGIDAQRLLLEEYGMKTEIPTTTTRQTPTQVTKSTPDVQEQILLRAYELYEQREKDGGHELDDWLQAENEVTQQEAKTVAA